MMNDELRLETQDISVCGTILDTAEELAIERDIVLPDYYPDVFRVLRCTAEPAVTSRSISGGRLSFEVSVTVRVSFCMELMDRAQMPSTCEK